MTDPDSQRLILVIDDSLEYLQFMEFLLSSEGFAVTIKQSIEMLQSELARQRPHLIITDVRMPGLDPFAVLKCLRDDPRTATIPTLLCTGAVNEVSEYAEHLAKIGVEVLLKPFDVEALLDKVSLLLAANEAVPTV